MLQTICQIIHTIIFVVVLLDGIHKEYVGQPAKEPRGATGMVLTFGAMTFLGVIYYFGGMWSKLFGGP